MEFILSITIAYIIDLCIGDPYDFPHPVRWIGKSIRKVEQRIRAKCITPIALKVGGGILWLVIVGGTYLCMYLCLFVARKIHIGVWFICSTYFFYTTLATKCLGQEAKKIYAVLKEEDIEKARVQLSYIVGRDTTNLEEEEIICAVVETVAENTVDGIISPMFYGFLGGMPLAMAYKAVNTLDSTVGYKNEKYKDIGFVSAKLDDVANFIPARLTSIMMCIVSLLLGFSFKDAVRMTKRDRKNHKSPNCAYPEASVAGALGIRLGGTHTYFGQEVYKPFIGESTRKVEKEDILRTNKIMYGTSVVAFLLGVITCLVVGGIV